MQPEPYVDCGHDLDAYQRQEGELAQARADVDELRMARDSALRWLREKTEAYDALGTQANDYLLRAVAAEAERDRLAADLASLGHWWCPNCEAIPPTVFDDDMCSRCNNQAEWTEPDTLTSVKAYAEKVKAARDEAWADRDRLADTVRRQQPVIDAAKAWYAACDPHTIAALDVRRPAVALGAALDALGDAGQPERAGRFEELLGAEYEQFDRAGEVLRSVTEYQNAPGLAAACPPRCCDMHNRNCEPPSELCCERCTEAAHDTFPVRHADGTTCVMNDAGRGSDGAGETEEGT